MWVSSEPEFSLDDAIRAFELFLDGQGGSALAHLADYLPAANHAQYIETLVELIRVDMELGWSSGRPTPVADYLSRFPDLKNEPQSLALVCFEEYRQRLLAGDRVTASFYRTHYNIDTQQWLPASKSSGTHQSSINNQRDHHDGLPQVGETFLDYELIGELGRGSFARVYLARQVSLSNRFVALKVTRNRFSDAATLARLQHTNIIPIYSVQQHGEWEAICMPYFGSVTVRHLLGMIEEQKSIPASAKFLYDTVKNKQEETVREFAVVPINAVAAADGRRELKQEASRANLKSLSDMTYTQSVLWMAKKIAGALAYAHQRGIVHRDLKPANILIADDGEPMLLDFNLSQDHSVQAQQREQLVGGTLPYMAPEQLDSLAQQNSESVDPRSDLYSFGLILYELLAGYPPFPIRSGAMQEVIATARSDRQTEPAAIPHQTQAIQSIIAKCLAVNPEDRYRSAQELVDDLDCELSDLPLKVAKNRSWRELARKWTRRHPRLVSASGISAIAAVLLLMLGGLLAVRSERLANYDAQTVWQDFQQRRQAAQLALTRIPLANAKRVNEAVVACDQALVVFDAQADSGWLLSQTVKRLDQAQQQQLKADIAELYFLKATGVGLQADAVQAAVDQERLRTAAQQLNQQARSLVHDDDFSTTIGRQLQWLQNKPLPLVLLAADLDLTQVSVRALCEQACLLSAEHRFREAIAWWDAASLRDPQNLWVWYGLGYALQQTKQPARAAECYSVCIALDPTSSQWYADRGVVRLQAGEYALAASDLRRATDLQPDIAETHLNLAIALLETQQAQSACDELEQVIALGMKDPQVYLLMARAKSSLGEIAAADEARLLAETCPPMRAESWVSRGVSRAQADPQRALDDLDEAIKLNAFTYEAYESKASVYAELLQDHQAAIDVLDVAVRRFPESGECRALRGVLHSRLQHQEQAIADARAALALSDAPEVGYCVAGIYANLSIYSQDYSKRATELLASSLKAGYGSDLLDADTDLALIRQSPEFKQLRSAAEAIDSLSTEDSSEIQ